MRLTGSARLWRGGAPAADAASGGSTVTRPPEAPRVGAVRARVFAVPMLAVGAADLWVAISADGPVRLDGAAAWVNGGVFLRSHTMLLAVALLLLGRGLWMGRWAAWALSLGVVGWSAATGALIDHAYLRFAVLAVAGAVLFDARGCFPTRPDLRRLRTAALVGGGLLAVAALYESGGLLLLHHRVVGGLGAGSIGHELLTGVTANPGPLTVLSPAWFLPVVSVAGSAAVLLPVVAALAPHRPPEPGSPAQWRAVRRLVAHPDSDTLAPFVLRHDKAYVFSPDGRAAVGYRVLAGVAAVGGDPVGAADAHAEAVAAFLDHARRHGWRPVVLAARGDLAGLWRAHGLHEIGIGDEAVLPVARFTADLTTRRLRNVRQAANRSRNAGVTVEITREGDLDADTAAELRDVGTRWLRGHREHGFVMNLDGLFAGRHPDALLVIARDGAGRPVAFQRYAEAHGGRALTLDAMRRDPAGPNGVNERMIVELAGYAAEHGITALSLNFAAFRALMDAAGRRNVGERVAYRAIHLLDPVIMLESLYRFNAKFRPDWQPRSVLFRAWGDLPAVLVALLGLEFAAPYDRHRIPEDLVLAGEDGVPGIVGGDA